MLNKTALYKGIIVCCLFFAPTIINAQVNNVLLHGDGSGRNLRSADNNALNELVNQIAEKYYSCYSLLEGFMLDETADNRTAVRTIINTYINAIQNYSDRQILSQTPNYSIQRSISITDVEKIFDLRRTKMVDMFNSAIKAEKDIRVDDALRYYNWGYYLLQSLPNSDTISMGGRILLDLIPERIEEILDNVVFGIRKTDANIVVLSILYKGVPVTSLDYVYFDGKDWSNIYSAKDGIGVLEFSSNVPDNIEVKCECNFLTEAHIDKEVSLLVDVLSGPVLRGDTKNVISDVQSILEKLQDQYFSQVADDGNETSELNTLQLLSIHESLPYKKRIEKLLSAIESKNYSQANDLFSLEGLDMYYKLISYGKAIIVEDPISLEFMACNDEVMCRTVPMDFSYSNNNRNFVENVNFIFNSDTLIDCISFGLGYEATKDVLYHSSWSEYARKILIEFLENYKTAYALKRMDYLRQIFDDDAYIIVGKVNKKTTVGDDSNEKYLDNKFVQLYSRSKEEYMEQLEQCFESNEFINIRFVENDIVKAGKGGEVYGIQIKQEYYSTNYADEGYLFLMVDLNDPKLPIIKVRVWLPERDPDFKGLPNFK